MKPEVDFTVYENKLQIKGFKYRNEDETFYDFTGSSVRMDFYKAGPESAPTAISGSITLATGDVSFILSALHTDTVGNYEYMIIETNASLEQIPLSKGNIIVEPYVPFSESIESFLQSELPTGFVLDQNFINQKIKYHQLFLQEAFTISDANIHSEAAWPILVNALIAKLIAYDALVNAFRGNLLAILAASSNSSSSGSSSSTTAGGIKSIETGPTKVEFLPAGEIVNQLVKSASSLKSGDEDALSQLHSGLCGLASKLTLKLPMCKANRLVNIFQYYQNPDWQSTTLEQIGTDEVVSNG